MQGHIADEPAIWLYAWKMSRKCRALSEHRVVRWRAMHKALPIGKRGGRHSEEDNEVAVSCILCSATPALTESHDHTLFACEPVFRVWQHLWSMFQSSFAEAEVDIRCALFGVVPLITANGATVRRPPLLPAYVEKKWYLASSAMLYVIYRQYLSVTRDVDIDTVDSDGLNSTVHDTDDDTVVSERQRHRFAQRMFDMSTLLRLWRVNWSMLANANLSRVTMPSDQDHADMEAKQRSLQQSFGFGDDFTVSAYHGRWIGRWTSI